MSYSADIALIPGSIVKAICGVQGAIEAVKKTQRNQHGGYNFASTDDIYAALTRKLAESGLMIYPLEMEPPETKTATIDVFDKAGEKTGAKTVTSIRFHFGYVLATEEHTWFDPRSSRTITVQHTGPQTYNAAESYCQKAFLRALFKLPTGDMDLDGMPQAETVEDQASLNDMGKRPKKSSSAAKKDGTDALFNEIVRHIRGAATVDDLTFIRTTYAEDWGVMPTRWLDLLEQEYEDRMGVVRDMAKV